MIRWYVRSLGFLLSTNIITLKVGHKFFLSQMGQKLFYLYSLLIALWVFGFGIAKLTFAVKLSLMQKEAFGTLPDGRPVSLFTLENQQGIKARISDYGGTLVSLMVPDRYGKLNDVVLGFDEFEPYLGPHPCFGTLIGRFGNRVGHGRFSLDGTEYVLATNNGPHHLHGGRQGFDKKLWQAEDVSLGDTDALKLSYLSPDGEEGYPGNLSVEATFSLGPENGLRIDYHATTDMPTVVNLTHHAYFNLRGEGDIRDHELQLMCSQYTPVDESGLPTGKIASVKGTPLDFQHGHKIGDRLDHPDLKGRQGFDHNFVVDKWDGSEAFIARVYEPESGRVMEVRTTQPGVQLYTSNFLSNVVGKDGVIYQPYQALCLETQHFPDSPNQPGFPSTVLRPGESYRHSVLYSFA